MKSAEPPTTAPFSHDTSAWDDVRRIYRRICVLRATALAGAAATLEHEELPRALAAARVAAHDGFDEAALFAEESERVAQAAILAEVIAPLVAARLEKLLCAPAFATAPSGPKPERTTPVAPSPSAVDGVPGIADLIDGMLSQDNARRSRGTR